MIEKKSGKSRNDSDYNVFELKLMRNYSYRILRYTVLYRFTTLIKRRYIQVSFQICFTFILFHFFPQNTTLTSTSCFVNLERL